MIYSKAEKPHCSKTEHTSSISVVFFVLLKHLNTFPLWCLCQKLLAQFSEAFLMLAIDSWVLLSLLLFG